MRRDMKKVIIERPRVAKNGNMHRDFRKDWDSYEDEELNRESMSGKVRYGYSSKEQTDLLSPLRRFLKSKVGKNWNDVWKEICENNDCRTMAGNHLRTHVVQMVEMEVEMIDGVPHSIMGYEIKSYFGNYAKFYVNPETNILCEAKYYLKNRRKSVDPIISVDNKDFLFYNGLWYRVRMEDVKESTYINDAFFGGSVFSTRYEPFGIYWNFYDKIRETYGKNPESGKMRYCVKKESANSKEISKIKKIIEHESRAA